MKARRFYPRQALRALQGTHIRLDAGQQAALKYVMRRGRSLGLSMACGVVGVRDISGHPGTLCPDGPALGSVFAVRIFGVGKRPDGFRRMSKEVLAEMWGVT